jgi:hypothetical protein
MEEVYFNDLKRHIISNQKRAREKTAEENVWTQGRGTKRRVRENCIMRNFIICTGPLML